MNVSRSFSYLACAALLIAATTYEAAIEGWRAQRETKLKADDGWLTVAGLFWLKDGANTAGSDSSIDIVLPRGPAHAGIFEFHDGKTTFRAEPDGAVQRLKSDSEGTPDKVHIDDFSMFVIHRGSRYGIRLKDPQSTFRKEFAGLHWFPVKESYRATAKFIAYEKPRLIPIPNILGEIEQEPSPGYVEFKLNGQSLRLDPVTEDDQLFFIFRDRTTGKETYPSGRFLYSNLPKNGQVELDFNKAENPPCAFTPFATCPLPPKQNRLSVRVEAGELNFGHHESAK
jgi:uncharacterized protein